MTRQRLLTRRGGIQSGGGPLVFALNEMGLSRLDDFRLERAPRKVATLFGMGMTLQFCDVVEPRNRMTTPPAAGMIMRVARESSCHRTAGKI
jgi:hypothetical protein